MRIIKGFLLLAMLFLGAGGVMAQGVQIKGTVNEDGTGTPIQYALISLTPGNYETASGPDGTFMLTDIPPGNYTLEVLATGYQKYSFEIAVKKDNLDLNTLSPKKDNTPGISNSDDLVPIVAADDDGSSSASGGDNNISGVLSASRDVYVSTASFNFGQARFRTRGYEPDNFGVLLNGVPMNNLETGEVSWSRWGGLNDVFRFRDNSYGLELNTFSFGEIGGATNLDIVAARQRKQFSASYAVGNRSYTHRLMATYSTGMMKNGWAVSASASWRLAGEGYVPGTFYDSKAYYLGVSKKINAKHLLSFTTFGTPTRRGKMGPAIAEVYQLANDPFYNPNWGYQNGKKRNSRVFESFQPVFMLSHEFKISPKTFLSTTASYQFGETSNSAIDWFKGQNPAPDYYRNLPSFQKDPTVAQEVRDAYLQDPTLLQLNWDKMYEANEYNIETVYNADGITGNNVTGKRSNFILGERVQSIQEFGFNTTLNHSFNDHISLTAGLIYQLQKSENFNRVKDLLGGDFYVDLNRFAQIGLPLDSNLLQNDLDHPNRVVKEGDRYGTVYRYTEHRAQAWMQAQFNYKKVDFFVAGRLSVSSFWRTGMTRIGLFPDNSLGKSETMTFINPGVKAGVTYKINGRHYIYANGGFMTRAPYVNNVFLSPRTRNSVTDNLVSEKIISGEAGYIWNSPRVRLKATGYYTAFLDGIENKSFFHDDYNAFVNMSLSNLDRRHYGGEFGVEGKIYKGFSINGVMGIGRSQYTDRPVVTLTQDNSAEVLQKDATVYLKNYNVASGPQWANTIGLSYNSSQSWFARLNFNYYDWIFVEVNPIRRTEAAVEGMDPQSEQYKQTITQERLPGQFTMDFFGGYSWKLDKTFKTIKRPMFLNFSLSVNNLTNNRKFISSGFEQLRFDFNDRNPNKYPNKYFYNFGINAFFNVTFRM